MSSMPFTRKWEWQRRQRVLPFACRFPMWPVWFSIRSLKTKRKNKQKHRSSERCFCCNRVYKPGSVLTAIYLALRLLAGSSRLLGTVGQTMRSSTALLRDRVYSVKPMLPWAGWALTPPFQPYPGKPGRYISVALVLRSPSAGVTRYPCPVKPGLSSPAAFQPAAAAVRSGCLVIVLYDGRKVKCLAKIPVKGYTI